MTKASELEPKPRCKVLCRNVDTNKIERCARWEDHIPPDEHNSSQEIMTAFIGALLMAEGKDVHDISMMGQFLYMKRAQFWYNRLILIELTGYT